MFYDVFNMFNRFKTHNLKYKSVIDKYPNTNSIMDNMVSNLERSFV